MGYAQTVAFVFFILMIGVSFAQIRLMLKREEE
jgi:ABC-type sugar transport system permease subunit